MKSGVEEIVIEGKKMVMKAGELILNEENVALK